MKRDELNAMTIKNAVAHVRAQLAVNPDAARYAMLRLFREQTAQERQVEHTIERNFVGFNSTDAEILTSFSKQVNSGRVLSTRQTQVMLKCMPKYANQFVRLMRAA